MTRNRNLTPNPKIRNLRPETQGGPAARTGQPELGTRNPELGTRNPECGTRNPEIGTQNPECGTQNPELGTQNPELEPEVLNPSSEAGEHYGLRLQHTPRNPTP